MLGAILIGVAGAGALFLAVAARRPSAYHVERSVEIAAPPAVVFGAIDDLQKLGRVLVLFGAPWEERDRSIEGQLIVEELTAGERVRMRLELTKPMKSTMVCVVTIASAPAGCRVTWSTDGNHNLVGRAMGMIMNMDKMLGADIDKGLALLRRHAS